MPDPRQPYVEALARGETVQFRCNGGSITPKAYKGDLLTIEPVNYRELKEGDFVFCKVNKSLTVHLITGWRKQGDKWQFQISNNHGHVNGWIGFDKVYGKLTKVEKASDKEARRKRVLDEFHKNASPPTGKPSTGRGAGLYSEDFSREQRSAVADALDAEAARGLRRKQE